MTVKFNSVQEADDRLLREEPLTEAETRALLPWVVSQSHRYLPRVQIDIALQQIAAINRFNGASGRLMVGAITAACAQVLVALVAVGIALWR